MVICYWIVTDVCYWIVTNVTGCGICAKTKMRIFFFHCQIGSYYHRASFSNLTSFSNFSTTASILEILPYLKLWYFFNHHFGTGYEFSWIYYVLWVVQYADQCFQIMWLCNILDVAGLPDYLALPNFYIISKHTKMNHNSRFGRFWEDLHENKKMYIQACQSVTSWDTLSKSAAMRHLLIALLNIECTNKYIYMATNKLFGTPPVSLAPQWLALQFYGW